LKNFNIAAICFKFCGKQWGLIPLLVTNFQVCERNIDSFMGLFELGMWDLLK